MEFIEKKSENCFLLHVRVKPNSKKQDIVNNGDSLTILLRSKPIQNKANKELLTLLKNKFKISSNQIQIISGFKSSDKIIELIFLNNVETLELLNKLIN